MTGRGRWALLAAGALLLAGCSNHSGLRRLHPTDEPVTSAAPPSTSAVAATTSASASPRPHRSPSRPATSPTVTAAAARASHGTSRHDGSSPTHRSSSPSRSAGRSSTSPAPARPRVAVTPSSGLHNGEVVTVSGTHLSPGERVNVRECWSDLSACAGFDGTGAYAGGNGSFRTQLPVSSTVWLSQCGSNHCVVRVQRENGTALLVPIAFG